MKELFLSKVTKPPENIVKSFSVSVSFSFFLFPCSKGQAVRVYLNIIQMTLVLINILCLWLVLGVAKLGKVATGVKPGGTRSKAS